LEEEDLIIRCLAGNRRDEIRVNFRHPKLGGSDTPSWGTSQPQVVQTGIPSRGADLENDGEKRSETDFASGQGEEIDPWTRRWFGAPPTDTY
jgi:hypothetical protein